MSTVDRPPEPSVSLNESDLEEWLRRARIAEIACKEFDTRWFDTIDSKVLELLQVERELRSLDLIGLPSDKVPDATQLQRITFIPAVDVLHPGLVDSINAFRHFIDDELAICDERLAKKGRTRRHVDGYRSPEALDFGAPEPGYRGEEPQTHEDKGPVGRDNRWGGRRLEKQTASRRGPPPDVDAEGWSIVTTRTTNGPKHNRRGRRYQHLDTPTRRKQELPSGRSEGPPKTSRYDVHDQTTAQQTSAAAAAERQRKQLVARKRPDDGGRLERLWAPDKPNVESYSEMLQKDKDLRYAEMLRKEKELQYGQVQLLQNPQSPHIPTSTPYAGAAPVKTADQWPPITPVTPVGDATWLQTGAGTLPESTVVKDFAYAQSTLTEEKKSSPPTEARQSSTATESRQSSTPSEAQQSSTPTEEQQSSAPTEGQQFPTPDKWTQSRLPWKIPDRRVSGPDLPPTPTACRNLRNTVARVATVQGEMPSTSTLTTANSDLDALESARTKKMPRPSPAHAISVSNWADEVELEEASIFRPQQTPDSPYPRGKLGYASSPLRSVETVHWPDTTNAGSQTFAREYPCFPGQPANITARSRVETKDASTQTFAMHESDSNHRQPPGNCQPLVLSVSPVVKNYVCNDSQTGDSGPTKQRGPNHYPVNSSRLDLVDSITQQYMQDIFGRSFPPLDYSQPQNYLSLRQTQHGSNHMQLSHTNNSSVDGVTNEERQHFRHLIENLKMPDQTHVEQFGHRTPGVEIMPNGADMVQDYDAHQETPAIEPGPRTKQRPEQYGHLQRFDHPSPTVPAHVWCAAGSETHYRQLGRDEQTSPTPPPQHWPQDRHQNAPLVAMTNRVGKPNQDLSSVRDIQDQHLPSPVGTDTKLIAENVFDIPGDMHDRAANGLPRLETPAQIQRAFGGIQLIIIDLVRSERSKRAEQDAMDPANALTREQREWDARMAARWEHLMVQGEAGAVHVTTGTRAHSDEPVGLVVHRPFIELKVNWRLHGRWCDWKETRRFVVQENTRGGRRGSVSPHRDE